MTLLFNHTWFAGLIVMLVGIVIGRARMAGLISEGVLTAVEANQFCLRAAIALAVVCGLFEAATLFAGIPPQCQLLLPLSHRRLWPFYSLALVCGALLLYWVWMRRGDETLAKVAPAFSRGVFGNKKYTSRQVRLWVTATIALAWGGYVAMRLAIPTPTLPQMPFCPQPAAAQNKASERQGAFDRRSWALSYFQHNPGADPVQMIGDYNVTGLGERLGYFSLDEARAIAAELAAGSSAPSRAGR